MSWGTSCAVESQLINLRDDLVTFETGLETKNGSLKLERIANALIGIRWKFFMLGLISDGYSGVEHSVISLTSLIDTYLSEIPFRIMLEYLSQTARLESPPYHWEETLSIIRVSDSVPISQRIH
jgi:hypothetical protein